MTRKIPEDAFQLYVSMGPERSYAAVAEKYGVTKRAVVKRAKAEAWSDRLAKIEDQARETTDAKLGEALGDVRERHLKTLKVMNMRAVEALRSYPLTNGMEAMRAAEMVIKLERLIHGEPTDRNAVSVEELIKREYAEWMDGGGAEPAE